MFLTPYTQGELTISFFWAMVKRSTFFRMSATDVLEGVLNHFLVLCLYILRKLSTTSNSVHRSSR